MAIEIKLKIADIIIQVKSEFGLIKLSNKEKTERGYFRFDNFFYKGKKRSDIFIDVAIVGVLPSIKSYRNKFITYHYEYGEENWRIVEDQGAYIFQSPLKGKELVANIDKDFRRARVYILPKPKKDEVWDLADITDDFLHVLLINYLAVNNFGFFAHGLGLFDHNAGGMLFCGKSGAGKSTSAKIWHKYSRAMILNDDRIIVRKTGGKFFLHSAPWHGEFYLNFKKPIRPAGLRRIFFLYHAKKNTATRINPAQAFNLLYSTIFPAFWDKRWLENTVNFCEKLVKKIPCYSLGFVNDKKVIRFVRNIKESRLNEGSWL